MEEERLIKIKEEIINNLSDDCMEYDRPEIVDLNTLEELRAEEAPNNLSNSQYKCSQCEAIVADPFELKIHEAFHDPNRFCPLCSKTFEYDMNFMLHLNAHLTGKRFECEFCSKTFSHRNKYDQHVRVHTNERPYVCIVCSKGFKQRGALQEHKKVHSEVKGHVCKVCSGEFATASSLRRHMHRIHAIGKTFHCKRCGETLLNNSDYRAHLHAVHPDSKYFKPCDYCSQEFSSRYAFRKHQKSAHPDKLDEAGDPLKSRHVSSREYTCTLCDARFRERNGYIMHRNSHIFNDPAEYGIKKDKYLCKLCDKACVSKKTLFRHMETHTEKNVRCDMCNMNFTSGRIQRHNALHHDPFVCTICRVWCNGIEDIKKHCRLHPHEKAPYKRAFFKCNWCETPFLEFVEWRSHVEALNCNEFVDGLIELKCVKCSRDFSLMDELSQHMESHDAKFACLDCGSKFAYKCNLTNHTCSKNEKGTQFISEESDIDSDSTDEVSVNLVVPISK